MITIVSMFALLQAAAPLPAPAVLPTPKGTANYVSEKDYPRAAQRDKAQGTVTVGYRVGTNGRVESCSVVTSGNNAALDETTCDIVKRWRFNPARDASGEKVPHDQTLTIAWRIAPAPCGKLSAEAICITLD
jgi:protein TonB